MSVYKTLFYIKLYMTKKKELAKVSKYLTDFQKKLLQTSLNNENLSDKYRQRIQIMLLADEGKTQSQICKILNCSVVTVRHWTLLASMGQAHNWESSPLGRPKSVNEEYLNRLKELINKSPKEINIPGTKYKYSYDRWTANKLGQHLAKELDMSLSDRHIRRLLKEMGLSTRSKKDKPQEVNSGNSSKNRVVIKDLNSDPPLDNSEFWQLNYLKIV